MITSALSNTMRQQRQASQEAQQRRALLQRLADKKQRSGVLFDSSSDSDSSERDSRANSPATFSNSGLDSEGICQPASVAGTVVAGQRKVLKRLSQQKENLPQAAQAQALPQAQPGKIMQTLPQGSSDASESNLLDSMSGLVITDKVDNPPRAAAQLAAAIATKLPDELPGPSRSHSVGEAVPKTESLDSDDGQPRTLQNGEFQLKPKVANMLYKHQTQGVKWLWSLHKMRRGGILGQSLVHECIDSKNHFLYERCPSLRCATNIFMAQEMIWG